jgi:hypothetical protein
MKLDGVVFMSETQAFVVVASQRYIEITIGEV